MVTSDNRSPTTCSCGAQGETESAIDIWTESTVRDARSIRTDVWNRYDLTCSSEAFGICHLHFAWQIAAKHNSSFSPNNNSGDKHNQFVTNYVFLPTPPSWPPGEEAIQTKPAQSRPSSTGSAATTGPDRGRPPRTSEWRRGRQS